MVVLVHTTGIGFGRFGVQLFFVISGYLLGQFYLTQGKWQFIIHRAFRLFPLAITFIFLFYLNQLNSVKDTLLNLVLLQNLWWSFKSFPGGWSISSEWVFSLILLLLIPIRKKLLLFILGMSLFLQFISGAYVFINGGASNNDSHMEYIFKTWLNTTNPFINFGFFVSGILILNYEKDFVSISKFKLYLIVGFMILEDYVIGHLMIGWQFAVPAIFILCLKLNIKNLYYIKITRYIGKRTYGTFFVHFLIWNNLSKIFPPEILNYLTENAFGKLIQFIFVFSTALIGGSITFILIEKPFLQISRKLNKI